MPFVDITGEQVFTEQYWNIDNVSVITKQFRLKNPVMSGSATVYWNGLYLSSTNYTISNQTLSFPTIPVQLGDEISIAYAILGS